MKDARKRILKMVQDGKLEVDEALTLLEELEKTSKMVNQNQGDANYEVSTSVKFEEAKKEEPFNYKFNSAKDKIFDFVDTAFKKIKDFDLDFNFGHSVEITHIFQQTDVNMKDIDIDVANGAVKVLPWDQKDVRVECQAKVYRVESQEDARRNFLKDVNFAVEEQKLRFSSQQKWMKLEAVIFVPEVDYDTVNIRMFNGPINSENLKSANLKAKTANGKINFEGMTGKYVEAETANGKVGVRSSVIDHLEVETLNGAIHVDGDYKKVELQSFNGDVFCSVSGAQCEQIEAKVITGSVDLVVPNFTAMNGDLKTNLGSFQVDLDGIQILEEKSEVHQKVLRFQSVMDAANGLKVIADTKTGSIKIRKS